MLLRFPANGGSILQTNIFLKIVKLVVLPIKCCSMFAGLHVTAKELGLGESIADKVEQRLPHSFRKMRVIFRNHIRWTVILDFWALTFNARIDSDS